MRRFLYSLDDDRRGHAARRAHRDQPALELAPLELVEHGTDQYRAGRADGVTQCDRSAVHIDLVAIEAQIADEFLDHDGKCLVDLPEVDVLRTEPRSRQHFARRRHGRVQHERRVIADVRGGDYAGAGLVAVLARVILGGEEQGGRAVYDARGAAGVVHVLYFQIRIAAVDELSIRDSAAIGRVVRHLREARLERGQIL